MRYKTLVLEGLEGAGKTTVCEKLSAKLADRGVPTVVVPEFSESLLGGYLTQRLATQKFLLDPSVSSSAFTQIYSVAADTAYAFEYQVAAAHKSGAVAIKDRGRESVVACQSLAFVLELGMPENEAFALAERIAQHIPIPPTTGGFWLDASPEVRLRRLSDREDVDPDERFVYGLRERAYQHLRASPTWEWSLIDIDANLDVDVVTTRILDLAMRR